MIDFRKGGRIMENLIPIVAPLAIVTAWIVLQAWILPRLGVPT